MYPISTNFALRAKNFDKITIEIAQTYSDGERLIVPPYEYLLVFRPNGTWELASNPVHELDGRHYVVSLINRGGGNYELGESISKSRCLGADCTISAFDTSCSPAN